MDTSETYIKMCEKAKEIQNRSLCADESNFQDYPYEDIIIDINGNWFFAESTLQTTKHPIIEEPIVWLPRQDQLQEMRRSENAEHALTELCELYKFIMDNADYLLSKSREQVELAALMAQKYNKVWNGEDWVGTGGQ